MKNIETTSRPSNKIDIQRRSSIKIERSLKISSKNRRSNKRDKSELKAIMDLYK